MFDKGRKREEVLGPVGALYLIVTPLKHVASYVPE